MDLAGVVAGPGRARGASSPPPTPDRGPLPGGRRHEWQPSHTLPQPGCRADNRCAMEFDVLASPSHSLSFFRPPLLPALTRAKGGNLPPPPALPAVWKMGLNSPWEEERPQGPRAVESPSHPGVGVGVASVAWRGMGSHFAAAWGGGELSPGAPHPAPREPGVRLQWVGAGVAGRGASGPCEVSGGRVGSPHAADAHYDSWAVQHVGAGAGRPYLPALSAVPSIFFERKMETQLRRGPGQREPLPPPPPPPCPAPAVAPRLRGNSAGLGGPRRGPGRADSPLCGSAPLQSRGVGRIAGVRGEPGAEPRARGGGGAARVPPPGSAARATCAPCAPASGPRGSAGASPSAALGGAGLGGGAQRCSPSPTWGSWGGRGDLSPPGCGGRPGLGARRGHRTGRRGGDREQRGGAPCACAPRAGGGPPRLRPAARNSAAALQRKGEEKVGPSGRPGRGRGSPPVPPSHPPALRVSFPVPAPPPTPAPPRADRGALGRSPGDPSPANKCTNSQRPLDRARQWTPFPRGAEEWGIGAHPDLPRKTHRLHRPSWPGPAAGARGAAEPFLPGEPTLHCTEAAPRVPAAAAAAPGPAARELASSPRVQVAAGEAGEARGAGDSGPPRGPGRARRRGAPLAPPPPAPAGAGPGRCQPAGMRAIAREKARPGPALWVGTPAKCSPSLRAGGRILPPPPPPLLPSAGLARRRRSSQ
ncbi:collagen alpha-1(I) chain-like [Perognathus longimembris pacificus]|uniref:collagen alpha-1(I) chain-like n=1 Tax=Perognathus longimembris pacificus TaxID=214514 RepID=UPI002019C243|nr:collagen alpha-1(I) chain-like [Perognathus longimembris pacificus]